ncbi:MAG: hypothetical protein ONB23_02565 [candidate division KSB1 bacterium]|nr:hypothetical protein [candidate division KSB1 bacterium]
MRGRLWVAISAALVLTLACARRPEQPKEVILARVGPKTISVNEFIRRAEYTIRPPYCKGDNYIHRKIVLNSLIAEKLLALEAGEDNELTRNEQFQAYLAGRREQAMREWLFYHDFYRRVKVDSAELKKAYVLLGRKYRVEYLTVDDSARIALLRRRLAEGVSLDSLHREIGGLGPLPTREVTWSQEEDELVLDSLFTRPLKKGQLVGPLENEDGSVTVIRVQGWIDQVIAGEMAIQQRWEDAEKQVRLRHAANSYRAFVRKVMKGKRLEFDPEVFPTMADLMRPLYLHSQEEKEEAFNERFWGKKSDLVPSPDFEARIAALRQRPFFRVDGEVWTVERFEKELLRHPLVFRKRRMTRREFPEQFRLAIADLIRDYYVTKEAYRRGYDQVNVVERHVAMWKDYLLATYQRNRYLESVGKKGEYYKQTMAVLEEYLNPYVAELRRKYQGQIEINTDAFEKIKLTRIDMFVLQKNVPFPVLVPAFPILTTHDRLDYGRKMQGS